jgi:hypothetical protein
MEGNVRQGESNAPRRGKASWKTVGCFACLALGLLLIPIIFFMGLLTTILSPLVSIDKSVSSGENILQYQFEASTHGWVEDPVVWGPGRHNLLVGVRNVDLSKQRKASIWLYNVGDKGASGREILEVPDTANEIAWSPDGGLIAIANSSYILTVSTNDFQEIARRSTSLPGPRLGDCLRSGPLSGMAFSDDGSSLWIPCRPEKDSSPLTLAIRLDARSLETVDHYDINPPAAAKRVETHWTKIEATPQGPRLVALVGSFAEINSVAGVKDVSQGNDFAYGIDLGSKAELFPHFQLVEDDSRWHVPTSALLTPDNQVLVVPLSLVVEPASGNDRKRNVDVYQAQIGERSSFFDSGQRWMNGAGLGFGFTSATLVEQNYEEEKTVSGTAVRAVKDGKILQRIKSGNISSWKGSFSSAFSWDRKRMVVVQSAVVPALQFNPHSVMRFYSVSR